MHALTVLLLVAVVLIAAPLDARAIDLSRPDSHAPIGVMAEHLHHKGEVMFSYRFAQMKMNGNRDGTSNRSRREVLGSGYPVTPSRMTAQAHMLGVMYAPSDELTLMAMLPYVRKEMDHRTGAGGRFTTKSDSLGDTKLSGLYLLQRGEHSQLHLNLGLSLPTGSSDEKDQTPMGRQRLPYPMQIGSGSYAVSPGLTYAAQRERWSWGAQGIGTFQLNENSKDYQLGPHGSLNVWGARLWSDQLSTSLRIQGQAWGNIHGADPRLNPNVVPTADPDRRAGRRIDVGVGVNWLFQRGSLQGHRFALEVLTPVYQWLDGPQLETDWVVVTGWQKAF
jgi:hypothetical protein